MKELDFLFGGDPENVLTGVQPNSNPLLRLNQVFSYIHFKPKLTSEKEDPDQMMSKCLATNLDKTQKHSPNTS